jgi:hypothetical protein
MIIDLRDYTTAPGARDLLIERCEDLLFVEQERLGASFPGVFCDAEAPDRFVWLRAMPDLAARQRILTAFYSDGALWRAQRAEVNAWLVDSANVLLVRPASAWAAPATSPSVVAMCSRLGPAPLTDRAGAELRADVAAAIRAAGGRPLVTLATDPAENNYPRHPIREGVHGLVWFASFASRRPLGLPSLAVRWLAPTPRSRLR